MSRPRVVIFALLPGLTFIMVVALTVASDNSQQPAGSDERWKLSWADEFSGENIDRTKWDFDLGNGFYDYDARQWISGWGNGERQTYTREPENAFVRDGALHIRAIKESRDGVGYTSARLKTKKRDGTVLFAQAFGKFEFRAKLPLGQGVWPALWLLPANDKYGVWASSGEIDILEAKGQKPQWVQGALHFGGRWPTNTHQVFPHDLPKSRSITDWHTYGLEWDAGELRWYVDGRQTGKSNFWWSTSMVDGKKGVPPKEERDLNAWPAPFDQPFYIVMNVAVGGQFGGEPDNTTPFPAEMLVDYVRVYSRASGQAPLVPRGEGQLPFSKKN